MLAGCQTTPTSPSLEQVRRSQPLLGTFVTITVHGPDRSTLNAAVSSAFDEIRRVDALMSLHREDSELSSLNRRASTEPVEVSSELFHVIAAAQQIARETDGSFDVTIRPLADLWGFIWKEYRFPTQDELDAVLHLVNYEWLQLDVNDQSIAFLKPGISIDLGGIAKGYAVDVAIERLQRLGVMNAMVKAGGDLRVLGSPPDQTFWTVQLEDPRKQGRRIQIPLVNAALSTSGDYENFFVKEGRRYSHILDPRTGLPIDEVAACTVIAQTCMESDAWATACLVYGVDRSLQEFGTRRAMRFTIAPSEESEEPLQVRQSTLFPDSMNQPHPRAYEPPQ